MIEATHREFGTVMLRFRQNASYYIFLPASLKCVNNTLSVPFLLVAPCACWQPLRLTAALDLPSLFLAKYMAHKHNRRRGRRTRQHEPNSTHRGLSSSHSLDQFIISKSSTPSEACPPFAFIISPPADDAAARRRSTIPAKLWQNRYTAWQEQDRVQKEQAARFEAQQIQLFGGEPGDDVELCYKMLEYFGGLDYIS
jgi:hypothetical protein